jgi:uncharacterized protein (DUF2062 family)
VADLFRFFRKQYRRHAPTKEELQRSRLLRPLGQRIWASELWRLSRRSVPAGVAVGLFVGIFLMIPGLQIVGAALVAVPFRANIPIAAAMTFVSNPATTPFFIIAAINIGNRLGFRADLAAFQQLSGARAPLRDWAAWLLSDAAPALVSGLTLIGLAAAFAGYWVSLVAWRLWIGSKWRSRLPRKIDVADAAPTTIE